MRRSHRFLVKKLEKHHGENAAALVVVLALLVLLTGVVVAYLSRSNTELKVSTASMASANADILTRSATEAIIAEIQKEIKDGSTFAGGVYVPTSNATMVLAPRLVQDDGASPTLEKAYPNLVRISRRATTQTAANKMISPGSSVATTTASLNKRSITPKRWNKHYLLPSATLPAGDESAIDPTPATSGVNAFPVPHWVMVTSNGPSWIGTLNANTAKTVIGRYAFAIYNEGGLLDANVAGYPSVAADRAEQKSSLAYADLTQLPLRDNRTLAQELVDNIVGWRNKGLTAARGNFPGDYSFTAISSSGREAFHDEFVLREDSGYTRVKFAGDQRFLSRQALIKYWEKVGLKMEALQYLTTFSRSLEQPSLLASGDTIPGWMPASNPSVLTLRNADGSAFVSKRFPLRRLAWLTPNGPSNGVAGGVFLQALRDAGFTDEEIQKGDSTRILQYFGLTWGNGGWVYNGDHIRTLGEVQAANEEPNFFELLKAAIPESALRMGAAIPQPGAGQEYNAYQWDLDENLNHFDRRIFQIGANIVDQYDADSFPTRITYNPQGGGSITVAGIESLPYIYGTRQGLVMTTAPHSDAVPIDQPETPEPDAGTVDTQGEAVAMLFPVLWNPHFDNPTAPLPVGGMVPSVRFVANSDHPLVAGSNVSGLLRVDSRSVGSSGAPHSISNSVLTDDSTAMLISTQRGAFVNPLAVMDNRAGLALPDATHSLKDSTLFPTSANDGYLTPRSDTISGIDQVIGVVLGKAALQWEVPASGGGSPTVHTAGQVEFTLSAPTMDTDGAITLRMEYETPGGDWVSYDEKFAPVFSTVVISNWQEWDKQLLSPLNWSIALDPRPSLYGTYSVHGGTYAPPPLGFPASSSIDLSDPSVIGLHGWHGSALSPWNLAVNQGAGAIADRDGIVRPGMAGRVPESDATMNPLAQSPGAAVAIAPENRARPVVLNRPFQSIAELGYVFSGMPWRNLDMTSERSGFSRLLDLFSLNDVADPGVPLVNGKVDLNTRQAPVLQAILAGVRTDEFSTERLDPAIAKAISEALVTWTKDLATGAGATAGPLIERSDLVSRYSSARTNRNWGFTTKIATEVGASASYARLQEASVRALANNGQTRVWNLMIDLVAQSGRYGVTQTDLAKFTVEGERRVWIHLAIDRFTGKVLDKQVELVTE